jgi:hypothetical protein
MCPTRHLLSIRFKSTFSAFRKKSSKIWWVFLFHERKVVVDDKFHHVVYAIDSSLTRIYAGQVAGGDTLEKRVGWCGAPDAGGRVASSTWATMRQ